MKDKRAEYEAWREKKRGATKGDRMLLSSKSFSICSPVLSLPAALYNFSSPLSVQIVQVEKYVKFCTKTEKQKRHKKINV